MDIRLRRVCTIDTIMNVELIVILSGFHLTWKLYINIICESNSLLAIDMVKNDVLSTHPYVLRVDAIQKYKEFQ